MTLDVGDRLPADSLEAPDGSEVPLRRPRRGNTVLFLAHGTECSGCLAWAESLVRSAGDELEAWDARLLVAPPASPTSPSSPPDRRAPGSYADRVEPFVPPALTTLDPGGRIRRRCGIDDGDAAVLVADRWGQVYHRSVAREASGLSGVAEIVKWARYMTIQCPECGVPDEPPGMGRWHRDADGDAPAPLRGPRPSST